VPDVVSVPKLTAAHADAWRHAAAGTGVQRDEAFLSWRYSKPGQRYECYTLGSDAGYLVLKQYASEDTHVMHVCDLVVREDARALLPTALAFAAARAADVGATRLTAWLPGDHPYAGAFDAAGLVLNASYDRYVFTTGADAHHWHLTQGDSDVY
jgi:hypothetical protein